MGKPLLTDEIIEKANRGEIIYDDQEFSDPEETKVISTDYSSTLSDSNEFDINKGGLLDRLSGHSQKDQLVYKSRRIENAKRSEFQGKLNKILFVVILLVILLIWAVFNI